MSCQAQLHVENLSFSYDATAPLLTDIHLGVQEGERVGLIGPNGAGKTTFFMLLCGMLTPDRGRITLHGKDVKPGRFNPEITYLFQMPDDQLFCATVRDDVAFGPLNMGLPFDEVERRTNKALEDVDMIHKIETAPHHMSGGEKRLAAFASVLSMLPHAILLDEPTSNLDARNRRNLINIINRLDITLLIASHDLEFLLETCNRVVLINQGQIVADGDPAQVMADPERMAAHHLETPHSLAHREA